MIEFSHSGALGDILYSLPTIRAMGGGHLTLILNNPADPPIEEPTDDWVLLAPTAGEFIRPLLEIQDYIHGVSLVEFKDYEPDPDRVDLDAWRKSPVRFWDGIPLAHRYVFVTGLPVDAESAYVHVDPFVDTEPYVVQQLTRRYRGGSRVSHDALASTPHKLVFVGLPHEFETLAAPGAVYRPVSNMVEMASLIAGAVCFVGNQSCGWALAQGMKTPRVLEGFGRSLCDGMKPGPNGVACLVQAHYDDALRRFGVLPEDFGLMHEG
jgi:hypothetical protein